MSRRINALLYGSIAVLAFANHVPESHATSCVPGFDYAVFGKNVLQIQGNAGTDSYDSSVAPYATAHSCADGSIGTNSTAGAAIDIQGASTQICGNAYVGAGGNPATAIHTGTGSITGTRTAQSTNVALPNVTIPSLPNASPLSPAWPNNSNQVLAPGKTYGNVACSNGSVTLSAGTYVVSSLTLSAGCQLKLGSGPIQFFFTHGLYLSGGSVINSTGIPGNLVFYGGSAATDVQVQGGAGANFAIYAPAASCQIQGNADIWGAMVCNDAQIQGNAHVHFDKALRSLNGGGFTCTTIEVSRSTPIIGTVSGQSAMVQGSFEEPAGVAKTIAAVADVASFAFPYVKGHMRARTTASIGTTASSFSSGVVLLDAGGTAAIPPANNTGCTTYNGSCRHLFTITSAPATGSHTQVRPAMVAWNDSNASAIGAQIAPTSVVAGIGATQWLSIVRTVLAAPLGGVDRSTVALIPPSAYAGSSARPTMTYFGADDGMLHAVCASTGGTTPSQTNICPSLGKELWAFVPRVQLPLIRTNTARVDGSPHVLDVFGDFNNPPTGARSWHTVLLFQTGFAGTSKAATYALDITDPANPSVLWEYVAKSTPDAFDYGPGMTIATGQVTILGAPTYLAFLESANGGSGGLGVVVTAVNVVNGSQQWQFSSAYPSPPRGVAADLPMPTNGIPGGAAAVDLVGKGFVTDVVFGDLYGDVWRLNAVDGTSRTGATTPLFQFSSNKHPIGVVPTIYARGGQQYAAFVSGGFVDPVATTWSATQQYAVSVKLKADATPVRENQTSCATCDLAISQALTAGDKGFAQAIVIGTQLFFTSDSTDVNNAAYGTTGNTGRVTTMDLANQTVGTSVVIPGGAGGIAHAGTSLYMSSGGSEERLVSTATTTTGAAAEITASQTFQRQLWLQTN